eukprot:5024396-Prymnesium_polylepis.1
MYIVEEILEERRPQKKARKGNEFLVRWRGYPAEEATWEPESSLRKLESLQVWRAAHPTPPTV